jgi:hypothetical protein
MRWKTMNSLILRCFFAAQLLVCIGGCNRNSSEGGPNATQRNDSLQAHGVSYDLPMSGTDSERVAEFLNSVKAESVKWSGKGQDLVVERGKISLNGKSYGYIKTGDALRLTEKGELFINGKLQKPE